MLPKSERLTKKDFIGVRPKVFFRGTLFDVAILPSLLAKKRFACVIAKKTLKRAVDRNRSKRRIYAIVKKIPLTKDYALILYPKKGIEASSYQDLLLEIQTSFATLQ